MLIQSSSLPIALWMSTAYLHNTNARIISTVELLIAFSDTKCTTYTEMNHELICI